MTVAETGGLPPENLEPEAVPRTVENEGSTEAIEEPEYGPTPAEKADALENIAATAEEALDVPVSVAEEASTENVVHNEIEITAEEAIADYSCDECVSNFNGVRALRAAA